MHVYVRVDNFTTKPRFQSRNLYILPRTNSKATKMKRISMCNVPDDENNLVQTKFSGEFWVSDAIMHKAHCNSSDSCLDK